MVRKELKATSPSGNPDYQYYLKSEVDSVMDGYETKIKELEIDNRKKLRQIENGMKYTKNLEKCIKELEAEQLKWISVKDSLPKGNPMLPALCEDDRVIWWGCWHGCDFSLYGIKAWTSLPKPPKKEEKNAKMSES